MRAYYLTPAQYALSGLALRRLKIARFHDLNDPFELLAIDVVSTDLRAHVHAWKKKVEDKEGLLCLSKAWRNPLLWGHYADKHRGVALGFEIPQERLTEVRYVEGLERINGSQTASQPNAIDRALDKLRYTKFKDWKYEDEVRLFVPLGELRPESGLYFAPFSQEMQLREIVVGYRCDLPLDSIRSLVSQYVPSVHVLKARIAYSKFGVVEDRSFRSTVSSTFKRG